LSGSLVNLLEAVHAAQDIVDFTARLNTSVDSGRFSRMPDDSHRATHRLDERDDFLFLVIVETFNYDVHDYNLFKSGNHLDGRSRPDGETGLSVSAPRQVSDYHR